MHNPTIPMDDWQIIKVDYLLKTKACQGWSADVGIRQVKIKKVMGPDAPLMTWLQVCRCVYFQ